MQNPSSPDVVLACVVAGDLQIPYSRAGRGEPVIVLSDDAHMRAALLDTLPRDLGAIAPTALPVYASGQLPAAEFSQWLWSFLDALGVDRATFAVARDLGKVFHDAFEGAPDRVVGVVSLDARGIAAAVREILDFTGAEAAMRH